MALDTYTDDIAIATEWSIKALGLMARYAIVPLPINYEVWFRYASGQDVDLNEEVDNHLKVGRKIDERICADLHQRYVTHAALTDLTIDAGDKMKFEVDKILQIVQASAGESTALGSAVRDASAGLNNQSTRTDIGQVVEAIVSATREMDDRSKKLEQRLNESKNELNLMQSTLTKARNEARTDGLTGVANRMAFDETLEFEIGRAAADPESLCLVIADIDHFKLFNDNWGHRTGDQVLRLVASCLKTGAREGDTVARYGGEEFAIIMPGIDSAGAEQLANAVRETVQARELVKRSTGESLGRVTMSLGVAMLRPGEDATELIERADACLYMAKRSGRNRVIREDEGVVANAKVG